MKIKRVLSLLIVVVMTMSLFTTIPAFAVDEEIGLTLSNSTPAIGDIVTATLYVKNIPTIAAMQFTLGYNPAVLTLWNKSTDAAATSAVNGINASAFLALTEDDATAFSTIVAGNKIDVVKGLIDWNCSTELANPDTGEFFAYTVPTPATALTVMTLRFKVIGAGSANLKLAKLADGGNYTIADPLGYIVYSLYSGSPLAGLTETFPSLTIGGGATPIPTYTVTVNAGSNGSVIANPVSATVYEGQTVTFIITPDAGNYITSVKFNDAVVLTSYVNYFTYTTPEINADAVLEVTFDLQPTTGRVAPSIPVAPVTPVCVVNKTFTDLKDSSGDPADLGIIAKSYYTYTTISNPDAYTLSSYGVKLTDVAVGSLTYGKTIYFAATKNYNGNFAALVFGDAFTTGNDYTLQGYLKYNDNGLKTVYSPLMLFTY